MPGPNRAAGGTTVKGSTHGRYDLREGWDLDDWLRSQRPAETYRGSARVPDQRKPAQSQTEPRSFEDLEPPAAPPPAAEASTGGRRRAPAVAVPAPARTGRARAVAETGAGALLAILAWSWLVLPFLKNGPSGPKNVLRAKFFNKAADGSWLP